MNVMSHRSLATPKNSGIIFALTPRPEVQKPTTLVKWQEIIWNDLQTGGVFKNSAGIEDAGKDARNIQRRHQTQLGQLAASKIETFLLEVQSWYRPVRIHAESESQLSRIVDRTLVIQTPGRPVVEIHPFRIQFDERQSTATLHIDPQMDTAIKTHPEAAKKCLVNWPLCTSPRDDLKPIIQHIAAQIQRWENEIPKSELTAKPSRSNRSNSVKHVDPVPVPRIPTHAKSATSNYFKVIGAICIAMALIAWVMAQVVTTGPTSSEVADSPPINRLQFISTQPSAKEIETHFANAVSDGTFAILTQYHKPHAHRTPALRQALLIQSLHGTRLATDVPMVVRALSAKFDRISNPVHSVMQDDLQLLIQQISQFKNPIKHPHLTLDMVRLLFFSDPERGMIVTDWTIPESTTVIGIGRRPFPGLGIECQGTFNMPDTPISTTAPQFTVLFTGDLIRNGRPEPVVNMPCWIVNGWHQLATFKKTV